MFTLTKRRERYHREDSQAVDEHSYPNHLNPFGSQDDDSHDLSGTTTADASGCMGGGGPTGQQIGAGTETGYAHEGECCLVATHTNRPTHIKYEFRSPRPPATTWLDRAPTPPPPVPTSAPPALTSPTTPDEPPPTPPPKKPVPTPRSSFSTSTTSPTKPPKPPPPLISPSKPSESSSPPLTSPTKVPPPRPPPPSIAFLTTSCSSSSSSSLNTQQSPYQCHDTVPRTPPRQRRHKYKGQLGSTRSLQCQHEASSHHLGVESSLLARSESHIEGIQPPLGGSGITSPTKGSCKSLNMTNGEAAGSTLSLQCYDGSATLYSGTKAASTHSLHGPPSPSCVPVPARRDSSLGSLEGDVPHRPRRTSRVAPLPPTERDESQGQGRLSPGAQSQESTPAEVSEGTTLSISHLRVILVNGNKGEEDDEGSWKMNGTESVEEPATRPPNQEDDASGREKMVKGDVMDKVADGVVSEKVDHELSLEKVAQGSSPEKVIQEASSENRAEEAPPEGLVVKGVRGKVFGEDGTQEKDVQEPVKNTGGDANEVDITNDPPFELLQIIEPEDILKKGEPEVPRVVVGEVASSVSEEPGQKVKSNLDATGKVTGREAEEGHEIRSLEVEEAQLPSGRMEETSSLNSEVEKTKIKYGDVTEIKDNEKKVKSVEVLGVRVLPKDVISEALLRAPTPPPHPSAPKKEYNPFDEDADGETVNEVCDVGESIKDELPQPRTSSSPKLPSSSPRLPASHPVSTNPFDEDDDDEDGNLKTTMLCPPTPPPPKSAVKNVSLNSTNPFEEDMSDEEEAQVTVARTTHRRTPSSSSAHLVSTSTSTVSLPGSAVTCHNTPQSSPSHSFSRGEGGRLSLAVRSSGMIYRGDSRTSLPPRSRKKRPAPQPPGPRPSFAQPVAASSPSGGSRVPEVQATSPLSPTRTKEQLPPSDHVRESSPGHSSQKPEAPVTVSSPVSTNSPEGSPARETETQEEKVSPQETSSEASPVNQPSPKTSPVRQLQFRTSPVRESSPKPSLIRESGPKGSPGRDSSPKTRLIQGPDPMASPIRQLRSDSSPIRELSPRGSPFREPSPKTSPRPESYPSGSSKSSPVREMSPQTSHSQDSSPRVSPGRPASPDTVPEGQAAERPMPPEDSPVWRKYTDANSADQKVSPEDSPVWKRSPEVAGRHKTPEGSPEKRTSNGRVDRHSSPVMSLGDRTSPETSDSSARSPSPSKGGHSSSKTATLRNLPPSKWFGSLTRSFRKKRKKNKDDAAAASSK